jgi:hypothetical protein
MFRAMTSQTEPAGANPAQSPQKPLSEIAKRALAEARLRKLASPTAGPKEFNGRHGLDPVRYGDWEVKGLASDF